MKHNQRRPLLAVDIGNNHIKVGLIAEDCVPEQPRAVSSLSLNTGEWRFERLIDWLPDQPVDWCVATVHREAEQRLAAWVAAHRARDGYRLLTNAHLPLAVHVDAPERVGTDRLLAALAVNQLRDASLPAVIIDAGSAITVDVLSAHGCFEGGAILPGFKMVADALARDTDLLPRLQGNLVIPPPPVVGKSTESAIRSGLFWGPVGAVRELVARIADDVNVQPQVFIAGGDAARLAPFLSDEARVIPNLVFAGIAIAHRHSVESGE
jgi:type III pantothenate kinase